MMRRRSRVLTFFILLGAILLVIGGVALVVKQAPGYYELAASPNADQPDDDIVASQVLTRFGDLRTNIRATPEWGAAFTVAELNAFLRDSLNEESGVFASALPGELNNPRVAIQGDRLKLAGRRGHGFWSTVISVELKAWLVKGQVNTIALEVCGVWAGSLPITSQWWLDEVSEAARDSNIDVTWYRHNGHPVGLFRFYADQLRHTTQIRTVKIADDRIQIAGRTDLDIGFPTASEITKP